MSKIGQRLRAAWKEEGLTIRPPASSSALREFEESYKVHLPGDLRDYLAVVDGMESGQMDSKLYLSFWGLARIRPVTREFSDQRYSAYRDLPDAENYFCFCDQSVMAHVFAIKLSKQVGSANRVIAVTDGHRPVAASFTDFVEKYLNNPKQLLQPT